MQISAFPEPALFLPNHSLLLLLNKVLIFIMPRFRYCSRLIVVKLINFTYHNSRVFFFFFFFNFLLLTLKKDSDHRLVFIAFIIYLLQLDDLSACDSFLCSTVFHFDFLKIYFKNDTKHRKISFTKTISTSLILYKQLEVFMQQQTSSMNVLYCRKETK